MQLKLKNGSTIKTIEAQERYPSSNDWYKHYRHIDRRKFPDFIIEEFTGTKLKLLQRLRLRRIYRRFSWFDRLKCKVSVVFQKKLLRRSTKKNYEL